MLSLVIIGLAELSDEELVLKCSSTCQVAYCLTANLPLNLRRLTWVTLCLVPDRKRHISCRLVLSLSRNVCLVFELQLLQALSAQSGTNSCLKLIYVDCYQSNVIIIRET